MNGLLSECLPQAGKTSPLQNAQIKTLKAIENALEKKAEKTVLAQCIDELENFSGAERDEVSQLLNDVRKILASERTSGLKSLLSKFKF
ncbi:MAG: hypothetical protein RIR26_2749 [Pseudomonadota bacterium]